jgi:hypothetical protein
MKNNLILFVTALSQVSLVAANVIFISRGNVPCMLVTGFLISLIWTLNVKRIAFSTISERIIYATGAMVGTGLGYYVTKFLT